MLNHKYRDEVKGSYDPRLTNFKAKYTSGIDIERDKTLCELNLNVVSCLRVS